MSDAWSAAVFRDTLQVIAESVTELVGFEVAVVSVVRDDGRLEVVAVAGSDEARDQLLGHITPVEDIEAEIANSEHWGALRFVPAERMGLEQENMGWIPDIEIKDDPNAWHPLDLLMAPFYDHAGALRGLMSIDVPHGGMRPGPDKQRELQKYAELAGRAVVSAHDRARLTEEIRLSGTVREVIRRASSEKTLDGIFDYIQEALVAGFNARGMWIRTFDENSSGTGRIFSATGTVNGLPDELAELGTRAAATLWREQEVLVLVPDVVPDLVSPDWHGNVVAFLERLGVESMLFTPLGAGSRCLGNLVLTRSRGQGPWTEAEKRAALDIGHDLGRTLLTTQNLERERRLNEELRALDSYKSQLIATVSHELRNPLTAVAGYLEMLEDEEGLGESARRSISSMSRGVGRMSSLVEDLLALSRAADPTRPQPRAEVDMSEVLDDVLELAGPAASQQGVKLLFERPLQPVLVFGDREDLNRVFTNLVSNAIKYSPHGGEVHLQVSREATSGVFECQDHGLGISPEDQAELFTEFFRSTNPDALRVPGTGLGLAIVKRIVDRYRGEIEVQSARGEGSRFCVRLPAPLPS